VNVLLPQEETATERKRVVSSTAANRQFIQLINIAPAYDDFVEF
jgi:hypothetical protein